MRSRGNAEHHCLRQKVSLTRTGMGSPWLLLLLAITAEVIGTSCLKLSQGFSRPVPSLVVLSAYAISMTLMSRVVQVLPMGLTYALWSGIGIVAIVMIGLLFYHQVPSQGQLMGMALITAGVITVNLSGHPG